MQENLPIRFAVQLLPIHVILWIPGVLHVVIIADSELIVLLLVSGKQLYMIVHMHAASCEFVNTSQDSIITLAVIGLGGLCHILNDLLGERAVIWKIILQNGSIFVFRLKPASYRVV